jgi:hypothetical protein
MERQRRIGQMGRVVVFAVDQLVVVLTPPQQA